MKVSAVNLGEFLHGLSPAGLHNGGLRSQLTGAVGYREQQHLGCASSQLSDNIIAKAI